MTAISYKSRFGYMIINKNGNPIVINEKMPIYWIRRVAKKEAIKFGCDVVKVEINVL